MRDPSASTAELLREARRHVDAVARVARALADARTPAEVFDALTAEVMASTGASGITVYQVDPVERRAQLAYLSGPDPVGHQDLAQRAVQSATLMELMLSGVEGFHGDLQSGDDRRVWREAFGEDPPSGIAALARLPLQTAGVLHGVLSLRWAARHAFPETERALLRELASHAASALRNAELLERERRQRQLAVTTADVARCVLSGRIDAAALGQALRAIAASIASDGYAIGLVDTGHQRVRYVAATGRFFELLHSDVPIARSVLGTSQGIADLAEGDRIPDGAIPLRLRVHERDIGVLWTAPTSGDGTTPVDLEGLRGIVPALALAADVVLLNETEQEQRARERVLATALATMDQGVLLLSLERQVTYANPASLRLFGYAAQEMLGMAVDQVVMANPPSRRVVGADAHDAANVWTGEQMQRRKDGATFPASVHLGYIRDADQAPLGQVMVIRDLTEERRMTEHLRQSEKLAALGELVAGVAHELNNPLAGISAFAQLLLEDPLEVEQAESVRLIKREADRAVAVIRDLLYFSRKSGPTHGMVSLNEIVEHTLRLRSYGLRANGIDVRVDLDPELPAIPGDGPRLHQVVLNLIVNAEQAMAGTDTRRLVVRTEHQPEHVSLAVSDTGTGISEEARLRIFEPFYTTKPVGEGTGLGLSVSYGIVRAHGGEIQVETLSGAGTTFRVRLPREPLTASSVA